MIVAFFLLIMSIGFNQIGLHFPAVILLMLAIFFAIQDKTPPTAGV